MSYLGFLKHNPELHKQSNYKMPGGKFMATGILIFFAFILSFYLLATQHVGQFYYPQFGWVSMLNVSTLSQRDKKSGIQSNKVKY